MSIELDRNSATYEGGKDDILFVNVTCHVKTADMGLKVTLGYIGPRHVDAKVMQSEERVDTQHDRHIITVRKLMRLPVEGYIICSGRGAVNDRDIIEPIFTSSTGNLEIIRELQSILPSYHNIENHS